MSKVFSNSKVSLKISNSWITRARGGKKETQKWACARELPPVLREENFSPICYVENFFKTFPHTTNFPTYHAAEEGLSRDIENGKTTGQNDGNA